jgi:hypothetical protein
MYAILAYDTEDTYYPPECRIDDIPGWLAEIMTDVGVTGTFFVMGEKAEELLERGRNDVLEKLARHDIASHQQGNRYPLLPQVVEGKSWQEGVEAVRAYEDWVRDQHLRAFGKEPIGFSRHNCYFAPQHIAVSAERNLPYMYTITQIPQSRQPLWYAGAVTFPTEGPNTFGSFDRIFSRDELFEEQLRQLDLFIEERLAAGDEWVTVFGCHPVQVMARDWLEHHVLISGRERPPAELGWHYRTKPPEEEQRAKTNFRRLCTYLKEHPELEVVGMQEAGRLFSTQPERIGRDALIAYATELEKGRDIPFHPTFSPAELICGLADGLVAADRDGDLPEELPRRDLLGPTTRPTVAPEKVSITRAELISVCAQLVEQVETSGHLPANLQAGDERLGLGQIALLAARTYLAQARYDRYEELAVPGAPRYPEVAYQLDAWIRHSIGDHWAMPLDFSCDAMAEHARLQTWTMKPAWLRPPQGPVAGGAYAGRVPLD